MNRLWIRIDALLKIYKKPLGLSLLGDRYFCNVIALIIHSVAVRTCQVFGCGFLIRTEILGVYL